MDLFMPAERVLYDRAYYLSDEAERDYAFEVAEEHGIDVGEVLYSDELMKEVRDALDRDIDLYLDDEIANFDSMLRELKRGENPEHPAEISVVAMGSVGRWDGPSRGLVAANSLRDLIDGKGSAGIELDTDFDIDPRDIKYTMMEPRGGKWESDRIDLYTPQDCFGFSEPFAGRIEYSEKKPKIAAKAKPDPADLGRRASVAAGATIRDGVDGGGIKL